MNVLKCEFVKLKKSMSVKLTLLTVAAFSVLYGFLVSQPGVNDEDYFNGISVLLGSFSDNMLYIIIGSIVAGLFICNDFENRTIQESIVCGNSHLNVVAGKAVVFTLSQIVICGIYPLIAGVITGIRSGWDWNTAGVYGAELIGRTVLTLITIFFAYFPVIMFFLLVSFLVQKAGISFAINIPVMMILYQVLSLLRTELVGKSDVLLKVYDYSFFGLMDMPFRYLNAFDNNVLVNMTVQNCLPIIAAGTAWAALFFAITVVTFKKRDLK